jgi:transcriptional regulator GlxA family with amidase domain
MYLLARRLLDAHQARDVRSLNYARSEARMLLTLLRRLRSREQPPDRETLALRELAEHVSADPGADWTQESMAKELAVSPRSLLRLFRKEYDLAPGEWVIQRRMEYAMDLLTQTNTQIKEIAFSCGYDSVYSFMRLFRKRIGLPPGQYRDRYRQMQGG